MWEETTVLTCFVVFVVVLAVVVVVVVVVVVMSWVMQLSLGGLVYAVGLDQ